MTRLYVMSSVMFSLAALNFVLFLIDRKWYNLGSSILTAGVGVYIIYVILQTRRMNRDIDRMTRM